MPMSRRYGPLQALIWTYARTRGVTVPSFRAHLADDGILVSESQVERWAAGADHLPVDVAYQLAVHAGGWLELLGRVLELRGLALIELPPPPTAPAVSLRRAA